jgi:hypothetical protein
LISKTRTRLLFKSSLSKLKFLREGLRVFKAQPETQAQPEALDLPVPLEMMVHPALPDRKDRKASKENQALHQCLLIPIFKMRYHIHGMYPII